MVVTGADPLVDWRREDNKQQIFSTPWPHRFVTWNQTNAHPGDDYHLLIGRCEQVFAEHYPLQQVLGRDQLAFDFPAETIVLLEKHEVDIRARIGYMPTRVWGCPTTAMWTFRLGPTRAKQLLSESKYGSNMPEVTMALIGAVVAEFVAGSGGSASARARSRPRSSRSW